MIWDQIMGILGILLHIIAIVVPLILTVAYFTYAERRVIVLCRGAWGQTEWVYLALSYGD